MLKEVSSIVTIINFSSKKSFRFSQSQILLLELRILIALEHSQLILQILNTLFLRSLHPSLHSCCYFTIKTFKVSHFAIGLTNHQLLPFHSNLIKLHLCFKWIFIYLLCGKIWVFGPVILCVKCTDEIVPWTLQT